MRISVVLIILKRLVKYFETLIYPRGYNPVRVYNGRKIIFIHINKTGGTSISKAIGLKRKIHRSAVKTKKLVKNEDWNSAIIFSVVRNPYSKVYSQFCFEQKNGEFDKNLKFQDWLKDNYSNSNSKKRYFRNPFMYKSQTEWLSINGKLVIKDYLKFEDLNNQFSSFKIKNSLNEIPQLTHENRNKSKKEIVLQSVYNNESLRIVNNFFREDFINFKYKMCIEVEDL